MSEKKVFDFEGKDIDVYWDGRLCIHIAECGRSEGDLFVGDRKPWCIPDQSTPGEVAEICERCPSGALTYSDKSGASEKPAPVNSVNVSYNGPYFMQGDLDIQDAPDDMPGVRFRAALCRCGKSSNKPFCDNSHLEAGFDDHGAIGERGNGIETSGGKLTITPAANGPLILSGNVTLFAGSGRAAWKGDKVALCRCGASDNKPFCDGSHKKVGFSS
ncbi:MAG: CDGSH iron-sulfur domain-containing protein [Gammaproteobacteria bacterium]|jgi:CDGSH-type Zn-finger protein/uncharacterized Fe-S cluster protein YjdI